MLDTSFFPSLPTVPGTPLRPRQLSREEERLVRYYRCLSEQDREAVRCLMFAVRETSEANTLTHKK